MASRPAMTSDDNITDTMTYPNQAQPLAPAYKEPARQIAAHV